MFAKVKERKDSASRSGGSHAGGGASAAGAADRTMPSIISRDMVVTGDLATPGEVHVEGTIHGDVRCAKLIIGATGAVHGLVEAGTVRVHGRVEGEIDADEVYLLNGSTVQGDIVQTVLEVAPGAAFEGAVRRRAAGAERPPKTVSRPAMLAPPVPEAEKAEPAGSVEPAKEAPAPAAEAAIPDAVAVKPVSDTAPDIANDAPDATADEAKAEEAAEAAVEEEKPARAAKAG